VKNKYQCFNCGTIEEREEDVNEEKNNDSRPNDVSNKIDEEQKEQIREIKCKQCGESKWIRLGEEKKQLKIGDSIITKISFFLSDVFRYVSSFFEEMWNKITDIISFVIVYIIVLWRTTTFQRQKVFNKITAFAGCTLGIYLIDYLFHCGFDHAAILIVLLYIIFKYRSGE
jgi:hypothetical protein